MNERWSLPGYGIVFDATTPDENGTQWLCAEDSGWRGGAAPRTNRTGKPSGLGSFRQPMKPAELACTLGGAYFGPTNLARASGERKIARIGKDMPLVEVRCLDAVGELFSMMELDAIPLVKPDAVRGGTFSLQFASQDPRRYAVGQTIGGTTGLPVSSGGLDWVTGGGLNWVTGGGLNWGTVTSTGQIVFNNTGTAPTDPVFTIAVPSGTLQNPVITFQSGQRLRYLGTLATGDVLRIDTSSLSRGVTLNGSQDVRVRLDIAEWWQLPVGSSSVLFSADTPNAAVLCTGSAYIAYW